jgi:hypothetical protein
MHTQIKPAMRDSVIFEVIKIFQQNPKESFRRNDIKIKLPEFIKMNYYDSELTRILQYLVDLNLIIHSPSISKKRRPGRPTTRAISGPKLYYKASPLLITVNTILNNSVAKNIIYRYLLDSGILFRFYVTIRLIILYSKKQNNLKSVKINREIVKLPHTKTESEFEEEFHKDSIKLNQMKKNQIKQEAQIWAKMKLNSLTSDDFLMLYPIGAIYYYANLINHLFVFSCPVSIND